MLLLLLLQDGHKDQAAEMATSPRRQGINPEGFGPGQLINANSSAGMGGHHLQQTNAGLRLQPSMIVQSDFRKVTGFTLPPISIASIS